MASPTSDKGGDVAAEQYALPSSTTVTEAGELAVLDEHGTKLPFKDLYAGPGRHLIVFIRHFFCGHCEDYVRTLSTHLTPAKFSSANADLTIVGCGQPHVIADYHKRTACAFPIYCDPDRQLYAKLGMLTNLDLGEKKPEYITSGIVGGTLSSMWTMIKSGTKVLGGGNYSQNGGEWLFEGGEVRWCHRMKNTRDHAEIGEVVSVLGLEGDAAGA
ncbi:hypothetical protein LTR36_001652 [Oleoguttula mirabilis]|uniref:AhpC/TSA antioxidant enzyme-domain-containing protein n=1 Tax=Oleoguttula mirabilis TaxID=1507867 RepID=A0AAV9JPI4_9PEZI|nr:hypothetical protein LTR36_001652 [Oleoguttula mirabilis]